MKLILNVTTEDGELLEQIEVEVTDDKLYPLGSSAARAAVMHDLEVAARILQARQQTAV